ncbi:tyrosinase family protein [Mesorhizobium sp. AR10]|uniref:tyrosinase family protein n=1 Tax=Mesorhizobium sp. AR10 TaxID=2865839 RepID=UPI00215F6DBB|nr:tyrosinase family protein [Mesorhizobium sp. AR10]
MAIRRDAATLGAGWNKTLVNYALAVRALDKLPFDNRNSWRFLGAMHGFDAQLWGSVGLLSDGEQIPADINGDYGNQCQHASWYFVAWHRGYVGAFEAVVAAKVKELTGDDWALPYWNYLDSSNADARKLPQAFLADTMPDGTENPLKYYGGTAMRDAAVTAIKPGSRDKFDLDSMDEDDFLVGNQGGIGFGGGISGGFIQFGNWTGDLESNPHNIVHVLVGRGGGWIGDPITAGIDPLFWLHHCNIDRLWQAWMGAPGKHMVNDPRWYHGPADRAFIMPVVGGNKPGISFGGQDCLAEGLFFPQYDDLTKGTGVTQGVQAVARVSMGPSESQTVEVIGANAGPVRVSAEPAMTEVAVDLPRANAAVMSMGVTELGEVVSRLYLALESVKGNLASGMLDVYLDLPEGAKPEEHAEKHVGSVALFGLNVASKPDGPHGGNGLSYTIDVTDQAKQFTAAGLGKGLLKVTLQTRDGHSGDATITVGRLSLIKRTGKVG